MREEGGCNFCFDYLYVGKGREGKVRRRGFFYFFTFFFFFFLAFFS